MDFLIKFPTNVETPNISIVYIANISVAFTQNHKCHFMADTFDFVTFFDYCSALHLLVVKWFNSFSVIEQTQLYTWHTNFSNSSVYYNNQINYVFTSAVVVVADYEHKPHPINSRLKEVVWPLHSAWVGRKDCWPARGSQLPWELPS